MSSSITLDPAQLSAAQDALAYIRNGYPRAVMRAGNYAAARTKTATYKKLTSLITADPDRIKDSLTTQRATLSNLVAVLNIAGKAIPLFRFDVSFMYPTVSGGVTAKIFKTGAAPLVLKHAFVAKMKSGRVGVFSRQGPKRAMTRGNYVGQMKQPIVEHFGPHATRVFEQTPGVDKELMDFGAERYLAELDLDTWTAAPCIYTMTPDEHFIVDRHPAHGNVFLAAGFSGHGFKFTPAIGKILADYAMTGTTPEPVGFLSIDRFTRV